MHLTGYPDRPPVRVGVTISDYLTGVFAAQAATAALYRRDARRWRSSGASPTGAPGARSAEQAWCGGGERG